MDMETPVAPGSQRVSRPRSSVSILTQLQWVIGVAIILATLFTAWTPGEVTLSNPEERSNFSNRPVQPTRRAMSAATPVPRSRPLVGIVVGHWADNNDPGAVCADGKLTELMVNQDIATRVMNNLNAKGTDVVLLKEFDPNLRGFQADALISIHNDSCNFINEQATGFKVASAMASKRPELSARLTACLRSRYGRSTQLPLHSTSITNDMTSYHAFNEIDENTPAAIIETGFLNLDRQFLTQHPDLAAQGITDGIQCFLKNESIIASDASPTSIPAPTATSQPSVTPQATP